MRAVAADRLKREDLKWWWCRKYNRPWKDPLLDTYTLEEIQIEYFMFAIEEDPAQALPRKANVKFRTGDELIDKWEEQLAAGVDPSEIDFDEGVDPRFLEGFKKFSKAHARRVGAVREVVPSAPQPLPADLDLSEFAGFSDDYTKE